MNYTHRLSKDMLVLSNDQTIANRLKLQATTNNIAWEIKGVNQTTLDKILRAINLIKKNQSRHENTN